MPFFRIYLGIFINLFQKSSEPQFKSDPVITGKMCVRVYSACYVILLLQGALNGRTGNAFRPIACSTDYSRRFDKLQILQVIFEPVRHIMHIAL